MLGLCRPGENPQCSSELEMGFLNVPHYCLHNLINTLHIMNINVSEDANNEKLWMICNLKYNLPALKSKFSSVC